MQRERTAPRRGKNERFRQLPFPHTAYLRETDFQFQTIKIDDNGKERETKHDFDRGVRQETSKTDSRSTIGRTARHGEQLPSYPFQFLPFHTGAEHGIQLGCSDRGALRAVVAKSRRITQQFIILHAQSARHVQPAFQTGRDRRRRTFRRCLYRHRKDPQTSRFGTDARPHQTGRSDGISAIGPMPRSVSVLLLLPGHGFRRPGLSI